jgi:matrixin family protein
MKKNYLRLSLSLLTVLLMVASYLALPVTQIVRQIPRQVQKVKVESNQPRWPSTDINVYIDNGIRKQYKTAYKLAIKNWNKANVIDFHIVKTKADANVKLTQHNSNEDYSGITYTATANNNLTDATVYFNDTKVHDSDMATLTTVAEHELGHAIGLKHDDVNKNTLMNPTIDSNIHLDEIAINTAKQLYKNR